MSTETRDAFDSAFVDGQPPSKQQAREIGTVIDTQFAAVADEFGDLESLIQTMQVSGVQPYPTTGAGLAATTNGQYFSVPAGSAGGSVVIWRNVSGAAVQVATLPGTASVAEAIAALTNLGDLASLDDVGTSQIKDGAVTQAKLATPVQTALAAATALKVMYGTGTTMIGKPTPVASGTMGATLGGNAIVWPTHPDYVLSSGAVTSIVVGVDSTGHATTGGLKIPIMSVSGTTAKIEHIITINAPVTPGLHTYYAGTDFDAIKVKAGWVIAAYANLWPDRSVYSTAEAGYTVHYDYTTQAAQVVGATFTSEGLSSSQRLNIRMTVEGAYDSEGVDEALSEESARLVDTHPGWRSEAALVLQQGQMRFGPTELPSGNNDATTDAGAVYLLGNTNGSALAVVEIRAVVSSIGTGSAEIVVATPAISGTAPNQRATTIIAAYPITITASGEITLIAGRDFTGFVKPAGSFLGIRVASGGPKIRLAYTGGLAFSYSGDPGSTAVLYTGSTSIINLSFIGYPGETKRNSLLTPWVNNKAVLLGDSITANYYSTWLPKFKDVTGLKTIINRGINGQVLSGMLDSIVAGDFADAALCVVGGGVNDWHHGSATIGAWGDAASANTIYGAVRKLIEGIYAQNTNTVPVFWGPFNSGQYTTGPAYGATNPYGLSISNITDAMADACGRFGVPFFATQRRSGVNNLNIAANLPDGLHPSSACGQRLGRALGAFVNGI